MIKYEATNAPRTDNRWDSKYEWKAITLLTVGFGLVGLDRWIIGPLFPAIAHDLKLNYHDAGVLIGVLGLAWGAAALLFGGLSDRIGRKRVLVPAIVLFSLLSCITGFAASFSSLAIIRALMGVTEGAFCPTSFAATAEASKPSRRGLNQGIQQSAFSLFGLALAPIIATQMLLLTSWRSVFVIVAMPGLIVAVLLAMTIRELPVSGHVGQRIKARSALRNVWSHRNVGIGMGALCCAMTGIFILSALIPSYLTDHLKVSTATMGFVTSAIGLGGFAGQCVLPGLSDIIGRRFTAIGGFLLGAGVLCLFVRVAPDPLPMFLTLSVTAFVAFGLLSLITGPISTEAAPVGLVAFSAGLIIGVGEIFGGGIAPIIAGNIAQQYGIKCVPYLSLVGFVVGAFLSCFLQETAPRKVVHLKTQK